MSGTSLTLMCVRDIQQDRGQEHLIAGLTKTFGHGMGLELRDSSTALSSKSTGTLRAGMVFNLALGGLGRGA